MPRSAFTAITAVTLSFTMVSQLVAQVSERIETEEALQVTLPDDPAAVIAVVGRSPILMGEVSPKVEARINDVLAKTGQQIPENQLKLARVNLARGMLAEAIQNKMLRASFLLDQVGGAAADKHAEAEQMLATRARQMFFESELPELQKQYKTDNLGELDQALRKKGTSLAARQRDFSDAMLGHLYIRSKVEQDPRVSIAEIAQYYHENQDDFSHPTRARWEQLTVLFSKFPDRQSAHQAIWAMGREVYYGSGNMQPVARQKSQEPLAKSGGVHDWTEQGALASTELDREIFSIELDAMSNIIEDEQGFHIVRVIDRQQAGVLPLSEVQDEIRAKLRKDKIAKSQRQVLEDVHSRVPVWSIFPDDIPGARPMPQVAGGRGRTLR